MDESGKPVDLTLKQTALVPSQGAPRPTQSATGKLSRRELALAALGGLGGLGAAAAFAGCGGQYTGPNAPSLPQDVEALRSALSSGGVSIQWCDTYAELRNLAGDTTSASENVAVVRGSVNGGPFEGGGGVFVWSTDTTTPDNDGIVIAKSSGRTGCWKRLYSGSMNVLWFGAKGDGSTDDTSAIQKAIDTAGPRGHVLIAPGKVYAISSPLKVNVSGLSIFGHGATLKASGTFFCMIAGVADTQNVNVHGLRLEGASANNGSGVSQTGILIGTTSDGTALADYTISGGANWEIADCEFGGPTNALGLNKGIQIRGNANSCVIFNCRFDTIVGTVSNYGYGIIGNGSYHKVLAVKFRFPPNQGRHAVYWSDQSSYCIVDGLDSVGGTNAPVTTANLPGYGVGHQFNNISIRDCSAIWNEVGTIDLRGAGCGCCISNVIITNAGNTFRGINIQRYDAYDQTYGRFAPVGTSISNVYMENVAQEGINIELGPYTRVANVCLINVANNNGANPPGGPFSAIRVTESNLCQFMGYTIDGYGKPLYGVRIDNSCRNTIIGRGFIVNMAPGGSAVGDWGVNTVKDYVAP